MKMWSVSELREHEAEHEAVDLDEDHEEDREEDLEDRLEAVEAELAQVRGELQSLKPARSFKMTRQDWWGVFWVVVILVGIWGVPLLWRLSDLSAWLYVQAAWL